MTTTEQALLPDQLLLVREGRTATKTAKFVRYANHSRFGKMLMVCYRGNDITTWRKPTLILPSEVIKTVDKPRWSMYETHPRGTYRENTRRG